MNALILCNGKPPPKPLFDECRKQADLFIAADGGTNYAISAGHPPDAVIGDLDSYKYTGDETFEVIRDTDQYSNDLEKALKLAKKRYAKNVKVLGATGLRLDQTLKNLSVLKQFNPQFNEIIFLDTHGITMLLPDDFTKELEIGTTVSLFPLSGKVSGITTRGLKYALQDGMLENGVSDGSSNLVVANPISIRHKNGDLLLFIAK